MNDGDERAVPSVPPPHGSAHPSARPWPDCCSGLTPKQAQEIARALRETYFAGWSPEHLRSPEFELALGDLTNLVVLDGIAPEMLEWLGLSVEDQLLIN